MIDVVAVLLAAYAMVAAFAAPALLIYVLVLRGKSPPRRVHGPVSGPLPPPVDRVLPQDELPGIAWTYSDTQPIGRHARRPS